MAFPIMALLTAAASDSQQRADEREALMKAGHQNQQNILRQRARELGGNPYGLMAQDGNQQIDEIRRQADDARQNNIGALLQSYLKSEMSSAPAQQETIGGGTWEAGDGGFQHGMGGASADPWDKDPWGDAGF